MSVRSKEKLSLAAVAKRFDVTINTLGRWSKNLYPQTHSNKPTTKINMQALKDDIKKYPHSYHYERAQRFNVSKTGIGWPLQRLKMSYKKNS